MAEAESDDSRHRAKVYCLNSNGQWDDRGTGHAAVQYSLVRTLTRGDPWRGVAAASRLPAVLVGRARVGSWLCSSVARESAPGCAAAAGAAILAHAGRSRAQEDEAAFVVVVSEDDGSQVLLQARVHMEDIYQRQQGAALSCRRRRTLPLMHRPRALCLRHRDNCLLERARDGRGLRAELSRRARVTGCLPAHSHAQRLAHRLARSRRRPVDHVRCP